VNTVTASSSPSRRGADIARAGVNVLLVLVASILAAVMLGRVAFGGRLAFDFRWVYYRAAVHTLHGISPYQQSQWVFQHGEAFVYPALSAVVLAPFGLLNATTGTQIYMYAGFLLGPLTLAVLRVRDWRIYAILILWLPFQAAWQVGNVSLPLTFLIAWRYRDRPMVAGLLVAAAVSIKLFVWPLGLWLLATRRWKAASWGSAGGLILSLFAWSVVGFGQIHTFLRASSQDASQYWHDGYSVTALVHYLGGGRGLGELVMLAAGAGLCLAIARLGWRGHERQALTATIVLMLVASPIVWSHYFIVLLVPLAISRPRLSPVWAAPVLMWVCPQSTSVVGWQAAVAWGTTALVMLPLLLANGSSRWQPDASDKPRRRSHEPRTPISSSRRDRGWKLGLSQK
jgi:hypothetical protein